MSIETTYNYTSGAGFTYNADKIGFVNSKAELILANDPGLTYSPDFDNTIFDTSIIEDVAGVIRQKDTRPANFSNYFAWDSQLNGNYGSAPLAVNAINGASISNGFLDLTGGTNKYVELSGQTALGNVGTIAFIYKPNYSGTPSANQYIFTSGNQLNNSASALSIYHGSSDGRIYLLCTEASSSVLFFVSLTPAFDPVAGNSYTFTFQLDVSTGASRLFINGVQLGITLTQIGTRGVSNWARVGSDSSGATTSDFSISSLVFYNAIVSPTNITPLHDYIYNTGNVEYPSFAYDGPVGAVQAWSSMIISDLNSPRYILNDKYWNGSAWVASTGIYAEASTASVIQANIATLPVADTMTIEGVFPNSNTLQASTSSMTLTYVGQLYSTDNPIISPNSSISMDALNNFSAVIEAQGLDAVTFVMRIGNSDYWFNGASWVVSNATYAQSNTAADINTNASTLPVSLGAFVIPRAILHSDDGTTTPSLTSLTVVSSYFGPPPSPPNVCTVFGYIIDEKEQPIVGATISVTNPETFINGNVVVAQGVRSTTTNSAGYFDIELVETESMDAPAAFTFDVSYTQQQVGPGFSPTTFTFGEAIIPNTPSANISTLTFI